MTTTYQLSHLKSLEAESIHIIREVAAEFERPVLLFSGGKDSAVLLRLAELPRAARDRALAGTRRGATVRGGIVRLSRPGPSH